MVLVCLRKNMSMFYQLVVKENHRKRCAGAHQSDNSLTEHTDSLTSNSKAQADYSKYGLLKPTWDQAA